MEKKKDAFYFSHDSNAKDDFKCMLLIEELGLEGYGIFWILVETLREQDCFKYPIRLLPSLSRKYNTTLTKMEVVIRNYNLFRIDEENFFFSESLNRRMALMDKAREQRKLAGIASGKARKKNKIERPLNERSTDDEQIKEKKVKENKQKEIKSSENESEKFEQLNEHLLSKQLAKDLKIERLENLVQANIHNQAIEVGI
ncbi:Lin1244/Lin1753 domain-containing protein [Aliarcobacter butzleri]|uniref:Lin1244/Lin1753 domain-containing protein n=1 Tax=Aliarcobacter butzleri TaxID=28197 RepID=UPI003B21ECCC